MVAQAHVYLYPHPPPPNPAGTRRRKLDKHLKCLVLAAAGRKLLFGTNASQTSALRVLSHRLRTAWGWLGARLPRFRCRIRNTHSTSPRPSPRPGGLELIILRSTGPRRNLATRAGMRTRGSQVAQAVLLTRS